MDEKQIEKIRGIAKDFNRFCELNLKIRTKDGQVKPLIPNAVQKIVIEKTLEKLENEEPVRFIILKARQQGVSTIIEALIYWWTTTHKGQQSKIIAHNTDTSEYLYSMFRTYYDNSLETFKPTTKYNTRNDITFDNESSPEKGLKSQIDTATAENSGTGRGQTVQWLHGSEVSLWPKGQEIVAGLMQAVPLLPNTAVFLESTANGIGDYFHTTWQAARRGESPFEPLFFPWKIHEEYSLKPPRHFRLTAEEKKVQKEHKLTYGQIYWRRKKMLEFTGDEKRFFQEYPLTDTEAFLASGTPRFNTTKLAEMEDKCYEPQTYELITRKDKMGQDVLAPKVMEGAPLKVWVQPQDGHEYVIGADVAEGIEEDYSCATVMDKGSHQTVARFRGDMEPADFGEYLSLLGKWYNRALIGCEINNHGLTTVQRLRDIGYDHLYRRESGIDERYEEYTSKLGWRTDVRTKPLMVDGLAEAISTGQIIDYDLIFIRECMTYIRDKRGRTNAQLGQHDDCFVRGTSILTDKGQTPIQKIQVGDLVMTREGLKPVVAVRKRFKKVIKRMGLVGTPEHPVITPSEDIALQDISRDDTIYTWNEKQSSIEAKNITDTQTQDGLNPETTTGDTINGRLRPWHFIANFGLIISEMFRPDTMSIMPTTTPSTMTSQILNSKQNGSIYTTMYLHQRGRKSLGKTTETSLRSRTTSFAWSAIRPIRLLVKLVENIAVHFVSTLTGERRVYNLQVADKPEYFANGILVHNCVIATAIALQLFEWSPVTHTKLGIKSKYPSKYMRIKKKNQSLLKKRPMLSR